MSNSVKVTKVTLAEALSQSEGNLWVVNTSDNGNKKKGNVILSIRSSDGSDPMVITIFNTWVPFNLIDFSIRSNFVSSTSFREYVRKGLITIITEESAKSLLGHPALSGELARLKELGNNIEFSSSGGLAAGQVNLSLDSSEAGSSPKAEGTINNSEAQNDARLDEWAALINSSKSSSDMDLTAFTTFLVLQPMSAVTALASKLSDNTSSLYNAIDYMLNAFSTGEMPSAAEAAKSVLSAESSTVTINM